MPVYTYHKIEIDNDFSEVDDDFWASVKAVYAFNFIAHITHTSKPV